MIYCMMHIFSWSRFRSPCGFHMVLINLFLRCYRAPGAKHKIPLIRSRPITYQAFRKHVFFFRSVNIFREPPTKITSKMHHSHGPVRQFHHEVTLPVKRTYLYISPEAQWFEVFQFPFWELTYFQGFMYEYLPKILCFFFRKIHATQVTMLHLLFRFGASTSVLEACAQELDSAMTEHRHLAWPGTFPVSSFPGEMVRWKIDSACFLICLFYLGKMGWCEFCLCYWLTYYE